MLKVKLARFGKRNQPHFRIVVNEARDKRDGSYVALLGHYTPSSQPKILEVNLAEYKKWLVKGAQPTETVAALVKRFESGKPFPEKKLQLSKKAQAKAQAPVVVAPVVETAAVETAPIEAPVIETAAAETAPIEAPVIETAAAEVGPVETPAEA